jgi:anti-sigma regulatory factor (Ser/Thr protein kinase)
MQMMMTTVLEMRLPADIHAPGHARAALDHLAIALPQSTLDDVRLLASELVTNSVRHVQMGQDDHIDLAVEVSNEALRVAVSDKGPGFHPNEEAPKSQDGRRGLWLVSRLAHRWGINKGQRFTTWFEMDLSV